MTELARAVFTRLDAMGIPYEFIEHPAVHTIEDCAAENVIPGAVVAKNYFLTTKNRKRFFLCLVRPEARFRTADISRQAETSRLSFAGEDDMLARLRVRPGAVSPMALMFDEAAEVELLVDGALRSMDRLAFHPCDNTCTLAMGAADFFGHFLPALNRAPRFVEIHDFLAQRFPPDSRFFP